jgi:hypothetical protein
MSQGFGKFNFHPDKAGTTNSVYSELKLSDHLQD